MPDHRTDRAGWDDLTFRDLDQTAQSNAAAKLAKQHANEQRRLRKHFWADQEGMQTWFYRRDAREW